MPSFNKDLVDQLRNKVFLVKPDRQHSSYIDHKPLLQDLNWENLTEWVREKLIETRLPINNSMNNVNC